MEFRKYNSIENSYQQKFVEKSFYALDGYDDFIVQEKIHGANFAFYVSDEGIKCAKRTSILLPGEDFFEYEKVLEANSFSLIELQKEIGKDIIVYGELFGGSVQKEVYYCKDKRFIAFDIFVDDNFLSVDECIPLFDRHGFLYSKILQRGTLKECFEFNVNQNSLLTTQLGLELQNYIEDNIMEGVVIRPNESKFIGESRIIFKKKTEGFSEKKAPDKIQFDTSSFEQYEVYITKPRLDNIISKYGEIKDKKQLPEYSGYFMKDICEDAEKDGIVLSGPANKYMFSKCLKFVLQNLF